MEILSRGNAARETIKRLKANQLVVILPDQNADEAYIPFFGKPAGTVLGPAVLHLRTKAPILPCCHLRIRAKYNEYPDRWKSTHVANPQAKTLGEHLKSCRLKRHLFQTDLAKLLSVDRVTIQNWERGIGEPAIHQVPRIIKFLGFDPEPAPATARQTIKYARRRLGLTQEELAKTLSVAPFAIWQWESGRLTPPAYIVRCLHNLLKTVGVTPR